MISIVDSEEHGGLPRQKINTILQYKKTNFVVVSLSYGYVAVVMIDSFGKSDVKMVDNLLENNPSFKISCWKYQ